MGYEGQQEAGVSNAPAAVALKVVRNSTGRLLFGAVPSNVLSLPYTHAHMHVSI